MSYLIPSEYLQKFSPKEIQDLKKAFKEFDTNSNGSIEASELSRVLLAIGETPTPELIKDLIAQVDTDHSNTIEFSEFLTLLYELRHPIPQSLPIYPQGPPQFNNNEAVSSWNATITKPPTPPPVNSPSGFSTTRSPSFSAASAAFNKPSTTTTNTDKQPVSGGRNSVASKYPFAGKTSSSTFKQPVEVKKSEPTEGRSSFSEAASVFSGNKSSSNMNSTAGSNNVKPLKSVHTTNSNTSNPASYAAAKSNLKSTNEVKVPVYQPPVVEEMPRRSSVTSLASVVQKHLQIHEVRSSAGGVHSYSEEEKVAFAEHINNCLNGDPQLQCLPLNTNENDLFTSVTDGILLCKLINQAVPDTIDTRAMNIKPKLNIYEKTENHNLCINASKSIGCSVVNIGPADLLEGKPILVLGLVWQIIKIQLTSTINLKNHPELVRLLFPNESLEEFMKLPPDQILLRWVNYHLKNANYDKTITNFGKDVNDATVYNVLLHQIAPTQCTLSRATDAMSRASDVITNATKLEVDIFIKPSDILSGNQKLNMSFVAQLFNTCPALDIVEEMISNLNEILNDDDIDDTREERVFRMWINSLSIPEVYINHLYSELKDGITLLKVFDKIENKCVQWSKVNLNPINHYKKIENCNYCVVLGKQLKFSLVNIGGVDITEGNKKLVLSIMWQLMRYHQLKVISGLSKQGGAIINDKDIIEWANAKIRAGGHLKRATLVSFRDPMLHDGLFLLDLVHAVEPRAVNWDMVNAKEGNMDNEQHISNAKYVISCARKIGAMVFLTYEDIVEIKPKMIMIFVASLMSLDGGNK